MESLFDYVEWRSDLTFFQDGQNEIDGLIFAELSYIPFEKLVPSIEEGKTITIEELAKEFFENHGENYNLGAILPKEILLLLKAISKTKRFSNVRVWGYVNDICMDVEKQFSAICFSCENKITYVTYRGTDDTIIGWKEDLNMALFTPIPSQREGLKYLSSVAKATKDKLMIVGHSKGGNIAIYSGLNASNSIKRRVLGVISYDGPGFKDTYLEQFHGSQFLEKIKTVLPSKSFVGRIFDVIGECKIVKSRDKGVRQHDAFTWKVSGNDFVCAEHFEQPSDNFHEVLKAWVSKLTPIERRDFVDSFYNILKMNGAETLTDITNKKVKFLMSLILQNGSDKKVVFDAIIKLIKENKALAMSRKKVEKDTKANNKNKKI